MAQAAPTCALSYDMCSQLQGLVFGASSSSSLLSGFSRAVAPGARGRPAAPAAVRAVASATCSIDPLNQAHTSGCMQRRGKQGGGSNKAGGGSQGTLVGWVIGGCGGTLPTKHRSANRLAPPNINLLSCRQPQSISDLACRSSGSNTEALCTPRGHACPTRPQLWAASKLLLILLPVRPASAARTLPLRNVSAIAGACMLLRFLRINWTNDQSKDTQHGVRFRLL